jgi:hypothetical protein
MSFLIKLKRLWGVNMSKLLELGLSPIEVANALTAIAIIKNTNIYDKASCNAGVAAQDQLIHSLNRFTGNTVRSFGLLSDPEFNLPYAECANSGYNYAAVLLVPLPDGRNIRCDYLHTEGYDWSWTADRKLEKITKLYKDRDILCYSTNPLAYLQFRVLPTERLKYNLNEDPCCDADFNGCAPVFLGIELEVEKKGSTPRRIEHMVAKDLGMDYMILKSDASLQNGFEIVTAPATIGFHLQAWDKFFDPDSGSARHLSSYASGRCGMHVHISRKALSPMHLGKMLAFMNNHENRDFITTVAQRNSSYSKFVENRSFHVKSKLASAMVEAHKELNTAKDDAAIKAAQAKIGAIRAKIVMGAGSISNMLHDMERGGERYNSINLTKADTVEFRIFRGNVSKVSMLKNIEFTHAVVEFCREATFRTKVLNQPEMEERKLKRKENTDYALHHTYFLDWLSKDTSGNYNNLKLWLQTHKVSDKFSKRKPSKHAPAKCRDRYTEDEIRACA